MEIRYEEQTLTGSILAEFRNQAGWGHTPVLQADKAVAHSILTVTAYDGETPVGIGRLVGDGALIWYLQDIIVLPQYQKMGIGSGMVRRIISYIEKNALPGTTTGVCLMAAQGKEPFYRQLGFRVRPNEREGAGMTVRLRIPEK